MQKVNAANAFEIDLHCLDNLPQFIANLPLSIKWLRSGEAIGAGAKVYGFRVDNVHNETYRILNGMVRGGANIDEVDVIAEQNDNDDGKLNNNEDENHDKNRRRKIKFNDTDGAKTLEKVDNLNLVSFDYQHTIDPLFRKTTKMFDEMSLSTLMSS